MRYWAILVGKLLSATGVLYVIWVGMNELYVLPAHLAKWGHSPFLHDLKWTAMVFCFHLLGQGMLAAIIWDQRRRCRTCGRRLRMPVSHGSYGQMLLFGRPRTDYICIYGHGTLQVPDLHVGTKEPVDWIANDDDIWKELYALEDADRKRNE